MTAQGSRPGPGEARSMLHTSFQPMQNDCEAGGSRTLPHGKPATLQLAVGESTSICHELDAWIRALEAIVQHNTIALEYHGRRPLKERDTEVSTTSLVEETKDTREKKSRADDDSAEINLLGSYRWDYLPGLHLGPKGKGRSRGAGPERDFG